MTGPRDSHADVPLEHGRTIRASLTTATLTLELGTGTGATWTGFLLSERFELPASVLPELVAALTSLTSTGDRR